MKDEQKQTEETTMTDTTKKKCTRCGETKNRDEFYNNKSTRDGLEFHCKECRKAWDRERKAKIREQKQQRAGQRSEAVAVTATKRLPIVRRITAPAAAPVADNRGALVSKLLIDAAKKMENATENYQAGAVGQDLINAYHAALELAVQLRLALG